MNKYVKVSILSFIALIVFIVLFSSIVKVKEGQVAVVYSPSGGAKEVLNPGWSFIYPWEDITIYPTKVQIVNTSISVTTNDGKKITMPVRYEMKVDKAKVLDIFKELGSQDIEQLQEGYLYQRLFKASRETISKFSVVDIYGTKTSEASAKVTEAMAESSKGLGFIIADVTLGTPELDQATQVAIDARVKAAQELEQLQLEQKIASETAKKNAIEAQGKAEKDLIDAQGEAAAAIAIAEGEAKANKILSQSVTQQLIDLNVSKARLEHGWVTVNGVGQAIVDTTK